MNPSTKVRLAIVAVIVLVLVAVSALCIVIYIRQQSNRHTVGREIWMHNVEQALDAYRIRHGTFPSTEEGLRALVTKRITKELPKDAWKNEFIYERHDKDSYTLKSLGADGKPGGSGDDEDYVLKGTYPKGYYPSVDTQIGVDEYEVFSTVLSQAKYLQDKSCKMYVVSERTDLPDWIYKKRQEQPLQYDTQFDSDLEKEHSEKNSKSYFLRGQMKSNKRVVLISNSENKELENDWSKFSEKYPDACGIITLSRVAFNEEKTKALVYFGNTRGILYGAGYLIWLSRKDDKYAVIKELCIWKS